MYNNGLLGSFQMLWASVLYTVGVQVNGSFKKGCYCKDTREIETVILELGIYRQKAGYLKERVWYEPAGKSNRLIVGHALV